LISHYTTLQEKFYLISIGANRECALGFIFICFCSNKYF